MKKLTEWLIKPFITEDIEIPVKVGDTILTGRFKNKKTVVKSIRKDVHGMPTINGKQATTFRLNKKDSRKIINAKKRKDQVKEGVNDPGILKAVFLAGGPGSGKTYVTRGLFGIPKTITLSAHGLKVVNSDTELERMLDKYGFGTDLDAMPDEVFRQLTDPDYEDYSGLRTRAKELTAARKKLYMNGRLGMIIDGTGDTFSKIKKQKKELENIGYDCFMVFVHTKLKVAQQRNMERKRKLKPKLVSDSWNAVQANKGAYQGLFGQSNFLLVDNSKTLGEKEAEDKFKMLVKKGVGKFLKKPVKNYKGKQWIKKQKMLKKEDIAEAPRIPRKKGQHRGSKSHSDLYTDENPKGTIKGLKFATVKDAKASVSKIRNSGRSHAHKIQAAVAMEQRAREMGKTSQAAVYRAFINKMKKKTKARRKEVVENFDCGCQHIYEVEQVEEKKWSKKYKRSIDCSNPKGFSQKAHCAGKKKRNEQGLGSDKKVVGSDEYTFGPDWIPTSLAQRKKMKRLHKKSSRYLRTSEELPSPSRKTVKKMKKKGHTSVPYGSGYKKIEERFAVRGNKVEKFITGMNLTHKGKKYKEIDFELVKVDNPKKLVTLRILAPKKLFGQEVPVRFQTLRRGPFLKTDTGKKLKEQTEIKKIVGVYGGRFQPFGPHHKKTYEWLKKRVDDAYITTSNIKSLPRHPMNFKEKVRHMSKMGIPKNRIVQEKSPYKAENVLKKYDEKTTAVVYIFGAKDAGRLKGGAYFDDYKKNKNNLVGYRDGGYVLTAPHVSVSVAGNEVSGTVMRQLLGSPNYEKDRKKLFKKAFGYFDQGVFNMMTNKFKKLFESINQFLINNDISKIIKEGSTTTLSPTDDGPPTFHRGFGDYRKFSKKWIDDMYAGQGWEVVNYILGKHAVNPDFDYTLSYSTVPAVAYGHKQSGDYGSRFGVDSPIDSYKSYVNDVILKNIGYELVKWMGITPDGKSYTGVEVETPVVGGVGSDNVANTETDKLDLKERINLDDYVKLIIEQEDIMDKKIKYKTKDGDEKEISVRGALKQGEDHPAHKQAKQMTQKDEKPDTSKKIKPSEFERDNETDSVSTKKRMDRIKSFGKDPHGNLYLGDEEVGYEPKVHKAQYVTETDDSIVIGTPHISDDDPKAGEFVNKQVVPMVQDFVKKHGAENVVFLGEGGQGDGHNYHEGSEQELIGKMVEKSGGDVDTWDGKYNEHTNQDAPIYKDLAEKMNATPSQMTGAMYAFLVGQGDDGEEAMDYLTDDGKQWLSKNGYKGDFPPSDEDVEQLFNQSFPEDTGKAGSTTLGKAQLAWNQLRRDNMSRKMEEYKKQGKKVLVVPGATHGSAINAQSKSKKEIKEGLIIEGGAYGHMNHPFDDKNLTFSDLKQIIINGLGGKLNREDNVTEKLDGQNLMISWVNGKLVTARNKGQLKNYGSTAMDTAGVAAKFTGRGDIKNAFVFAMKDLSKAVGKLSDAQKEKVFGNGKRWMNLEIIYPASTNVIDYDKTEIIFHGTLEYNESGRAIGQPKDSARMLAGMIKQVNQKVQKKYTIGKPNFLKVPKVQDFAKKKQGFISRLDKLKREFALNDSDTLAKYHQSFWEEFIFNASKQFNYDMPNKILIDLTKRWAFLDKSYSVAQMRKDIKNEEFLDWALSFDKTDHIKYVKDNMKPFEVLFLDVGVEILKNMSGFLAASPKSAVQKIRKDVVRAINTVSRSKDVKKINTLSAQIDKLEAIGGLSSIVPSEGIVFKYKGKTYKFTGAFAPVNQIVGLLNF
mgnify:CR=1 FL=1